MKRVVPLIAVIALMLLLALPASAMGTKTMYAVKDGVKAYDQPSKHGDVVYLLDEGEEVECIDKSDDGNWYGFYWGDDLIWVQKKYLSATLSCDHEWGRWKITREPTCTRTGKRTRECKLCGEVETQELKKLDHEYGRWIELARATCTQEGKQVRNCVVCGYEQTETVAKLPHSYGGWTTTLQPTCTTPGMRMHKCQVCGFEEVVGLDKTPHNFGVWQVTVAATDHTSGVRVHACVDCGRTESMVFDPAGTLRRGDRGEQVRQVQQLLADQGYMSQGAVDGIFGDSMERAVMQFQRSQGINPDGVAWPQTQKRLVHDFGDWITVTPLTRAADGQRVRSCKDCGYQQYETLTAAPAFLRRDRGEAVRTLQEMLNALGFSAGSADGIYGGKLDGAFEAFSRAYGFDFVPGRVRPADVDNLMNQWIALQSNLNWNGAGTSRSPVVLTLTVTPAWTPGDDPGDLPSFNWSLTNLGAQSCKLRAVLMGFGKDHSFLADDFVMHVDGETLRPNGANRLSGSFTVNTAWAPLQPTDAPLPALSFCALGTNGNDKWLSNTVVWSDN